MQMKRKKQTYQMPAQVQPESRLSTILLTIIIVVSVFTVGFLVLRGQGNNTSQPLANSNAQLQAKTYAQPTAQGGNSNGQGATLTADGYQEIKMTADSSGFSPRTFVLKKGVPVRWIIDGKELIGCNDNVKVSAYNIYQELTQGEKTTVMFTPTQSGTIPFSCGMGMIRGNFIVKDNIDLSDNNVIEAQIAAVPAPTGGGCGCGARR
jgi:hypothetical protein